MKNDELLPSGNAGACPHKNLYYNVCEDCGQDEKVNIQTKAVASNTGKPLNDDMDARRWADEFNGVLVSKGDQPYDPGWLIGWFANAIMCGFDEASRKSRKRIADLEKELRIETDQHTSTLAESLRQLTALQERNAELEAVNIVLIGQAEDDAIHIKKLQQEDEKLGLELSELQERNGVLEDQMENTRIICEGKVADLEKRNAEQSKHIESQDAIILDTFKKLKTAEDALAKEKLQHETAGKNFEEEIDSVRKLWVQAQKECEEQARLNGMGASREAALMGKLERINSMCGHPDAAQACRNILEFLKECAWLHVKT